MSIAKNFNRTTWCNASELRTLTKEEVQAHILGITHQKGTGTLRKGECGNGLAVMDYTNATPHIVDTLNDDCYDGIMAGLFKATCPNAKFNILDEILRTRQCFTDSNGNVFCISQQQFFNQLFAGLSCQGNTCGLCIKTYALENMDPTIAAKIKVDWPDWNAPVDCNIYSWTFAL